MSNKRNYTSWRRLLLQHRADYSSWLLSAELAHKMVEAIANDLKTYLKWRLTTPSKCIDFWNNRDAVRASCNDNSTYEKPFAAEAYAFTHMVERYWRTWNVLRHLTDMCLLPLGKNGIRMLDVGTGPGPTPYAVLDFYALLRDYGSTRNIDLFSTQKVDVQVIEQSRGMNRFLHWFSELSNRPGPYGAYKVDFGQLDSATARQRLQKELRSQEFYDPVTAESYPEYSTIEANYIAQAHERFRLVIFSNFFTLADTVEKYKSTIESLFLDLRPGSVVLILGATGRNDANDKYQIIYKQLTELAVKNGMQKVTDERMEPFDDRVHTIIKQAQYEVVLHLDQIAGVDKISRKPPHSHYWQPDSKPKIQSSFTLQAYRKGKW